MPYKYILHAARNHLVCSLKFFKKASFLNLRSWLHTPSFRQQSSIPESPKKNVDWKFFHGSMKEETRGIFQPDFCCKIIRKQGEQTCCGPSLQVEIDTLWFWLTNEKLVTNTVVQNCLESPHHLKVAKGSFGRNKAYGAKIQYRHPWNHGNYKYVLLWRWLYTNIILWRHGDCMRDMKQHHFFSLSHFGPRNRSFPTKYVIPEKF